MSISPWNLIREKKSVVIVCAALLIAGIATTTSQIVRARNAEAIAANERTKADLAERAASAAAQRAEHASKREAEERSKAEEFHYLSNVQLAATRIKAGLPGMAQDALANTAERLRHFEHEYLSALSDQCILCLKGHQGPLTSVQYNSEGTQILTASSDQTARIWDAALGKELMQLVGHAGPVTHAIFTADGNRILTVSEDLSARIWDVKSGRELLQLRGHLKPIKFLIQSPDGKLIFTALMSPFGSGAAVMVLSVIV